MPPTFELLLGLYTYTYPMLSGYRLPYHCQFHTYPASMYIQRGIKRLDKGWECHPNVRIFAGKKTSFLWDGGGKFDRDIEASMNEIKWIAATIPRSVLKIPTTISRSLISYPMLLASISWSLITYPMLPPPLTEAKNFRRPPFHEFSTWKIKCLKTPQNEEKNVILGTF